MFQGCTCALIANGSKLSCWLFVGFIPLSEKIVDILPKRDIDLGQMVGISSLEKSVVWIFTFHSSDDYIKSFFDMEIIDGLVGRTDHLGLEAVEFKLDFNPLIMF